MHINTNYHSVVCGLVMDTQKPETLIETNTISLKNALNSSPYIQLICTIIPAIQVNIATLNLHSFFF